MTQKSTQGRPGNRAVCFFDGNCKFRTCVKANWFRGMSYRCPHMALARLQTGWLAGELSFVDAGRIVRAMWQVLVAISVARHIHLVAFSGIGFSDLLHH